MYGAKFYNKTTRRLVAVFGTHFNDIRIDRRDSQDALVQTTLVPIAYGPAQKFLAKIRQDGTLSSPAMQLPRMSFEITGMQYSPERKLLGTQRFSYKNATDPTVLSSVLVPTPYDINFQLSIMTKYKEDGMKILEQILPYFKPSVTPSVKLLDNVDQYFDLPIVLNGVSSEDSYESSFEDYHTMVWTLDFTMKGYFFGPLSDRKVIKFANTSVHTTMDATKVSEFVNVYPEIVGANTAPTDIEVDDDYIVVVEVENGS